ncbi:MAG: type I-E CRISPR-associated protein Cas5/CasD [Bacillota bacterium]|jgi:CRISPR system Cascade subunit CasD
MDNPLILMLRLEGPLQSWGERARWDYRDTAAIPTKSGVVGLLACAMGMPRLDPSILELDEKLMMGVRVDRAGTVMTDYQTSSGFIRTADGKQRGVKGRESTIQSWRQYLQDAAFLVALSGDETLLRQCVIGLQRPRWPVFLGRKSCVPTRPVFEALTNKFGSLEDVLRHYPLSEHGDQGHDLVCEIELLLHGEYRRRDKILGTPFPMYGERRIQIIAVPSKEVRPQ